MSQESPSPEKLFGQIVIAKHLASAEHVEECLSIQAQSSHVDGEVPTLGEILVQRGYITPTQLEMVLAEQKRRSGPRRFGAYEILSKIGEGGMGMVYRARHLESSELVALKVVSKRVAQDEAVRQRFIREANVGMKLDHPNIVATRDAGEVRGVLYLALELIQGGSLRDRLKKKKIFTELEALQMIQDIALALEYAHSKGLVHRDIKPENILFDSTFAVKLSDFGLVKYTDPQSSSLTHTGTTVGTPHYISPEQARAESDIDIRADIYSLGATLYRLVTGQTPFQGASPLVVMTKHLSEQIQPPDELNPELSEGCVALVEKMMAKDREDRYATPALLIRDIDRVIGGKLPEAAPLAATKSSVGRSAVRDEKAKSGRRSTRRVAMASKGRDKRRTTGLRQPVKSRQDNAGAGKPFRPGPSLNALFVMAAVIAVLVGAWALVDPSKEPMMDNADPVRTELSEVQKLFKGRVEQYVPATGAITLFYDFSKKEQLDDWETSPMLKSKAPVMNADIREGRLYAASNGAFSGISTKALFSGDIEFSFESKMDLETRSVAGRILYATGSPDQRDALGYVRFVTNIKSKPSLSLVHHGRHGFHRTGAELAKNYKWGIICKNKLHVSNGNVSASVSDKVLVRDWHPEGKGDSLPKHLTGIRLDLSIGMWRKGWAVDNVRIRGTLDQDWLRKNVNRP